MKKASTKPFFSLQMGGEARNFRSYFSKRVREEPNLAVFLITRKVCDKIKKEETFLNYVLLRLKRPNYSEDHCF